jgi:phosphate uptake regulator
MSNEKLTFDNFYEFLNKKYLNISHKLKKQKKLYKLAKQSGGGGSVGEIQLNIIYLEKMLEILKEKLKTGQAINFDIISKPIEQLTDQLKNVSDDLNRKFDTNAQKANYDGYISQIGMLEKFITGYKDEVLNFQIANNTKFIQPQINIPSIEANFGKLFEQVQTNITSLLKDITAEEAKEDALFQTNIVNLRSAFGILTQKMSEIVPATRTIEDKMNEINRYVDSFGDVSILFDEQKFRAATPEDTELITVSKLDGLIVGAPDEAMSPVIGNLDALIRDVNINPNSLIQPDLLDISKNGPELAPRGQVPSLQAVTPVAASAAAPRSASPPQNTVASASLLPLQKLVPSASLMPPVPRRGGGMMKQLIDDTKMQKITKEIYRKWLQDLDEIKQKVQQMKQQDELKRVELERLQLVERPKSQAKIAEFKRDKLPQLSSQIERIRTLLLTLEGDNTTMYKEKNIDCKNETSQIKSLFDKLNTLLQTIAKTIEGIQKEIESIEMEINSSNLKTLERFNKLNENVDSIIRRIDMTLTSVETDIQSANVNFKEQCVLGLQERISMMESYVPPNLEKLYKLLRQIGEINPPITKEKVAAKIKSIKNVTPIFNYIKKSEQNNNSIIQILFGPTKSIKVEGDIRAEYEKIRNEFTDYNNKLEQLRAQVSVLKQPIQGGGFIPQWETYYTELIKLLSKLTEYKKKFNEFTKNANQFNLLYMQLFNHQLFISNYVQLVLLNKEYLQI